MFFTFEISNPFQWKPGFWRCAGVTSWRIWWAWFSISCHPMRYDEMIDLAGSGAFAWHKSRPTKHALDLPKCPRCKIERQLLYRCPHCQSLESASR